LFDIDGIHLEFQDRALKAMVKLALRKKIGARALRSIIEETMLNIMFELPSMDRINNCTITEDVVLRDKKPIYQYRERLKKKTRA
jgi:ATP-dependent Clp protease ATP-binding subunit ClpX